MDILKNWGQSLIEKYGYEAAKEIFSTTVTSTITVVSYILFIGIAIAIAFAAKRAAIQHKPVKATILLILTNIFSPLVALILAAYAIFKWAQKADTGIIDNEHKPSPMSLTQQSFEEWKAEKQKRDQGGFVDLDAPVRLPWRRIA